MTDPIYSVSTCLSVRLQVSFIRLHFRYFGRIFSFRTVNSSKESRVVPPTLWFLRKRIDIIFRGRCRPRKLKSAKNNPHVFETKPRKFGDAKISHYTVLKSATIGIKMSGRYAEINKICSIWLLKIQNPHQKPDFHSIKIGGKKVSWHYDINKRK